MSQKPIELILLRQLADRLGMPAALIDSQGTLVHVNRSAEALFGIECDAIREMPFTQAVKLIDPSDEDGHPIAPERMPLAMANRDRRPQRATLWAHGPNGVVRHIATTAIPLEGQGGTPLGAMSIFWAIDGAGEPVDGGPSPDGTATG